ncbi:MAG: hypothetical protein ABSH20_16195 [Tepidisphaeraceae bacterium]
MTYPLLAAVAVLLAPLAACAADGPARPSPTESDARIQAHGKGRRMEKAKIVDVKRPRVLLVGDSILNGYRRRTDRRETPQAGGSGRQGGRPG